MPEHLIALGDGRVCDTRSMTVDDLRTLIKAMEMDVVVHGADRMPQGYIQLVTILYQRTGGRAPGAPSKVAVYGDSKNAKSTWRKL